MKIFSCLWLSLVPSLQQCKYFHVLGDDALPSSAAHCAHMLCRGRPMASHMCPWCWCKHQWGLLGAEAVGTCWMHHHTHAPPYGRHVPHHHAEYREALVSASCGVMQSVLVGCSALAGQPLVTFASEAARAAVRTCSVMGPAMRRLPRVLHTYMRTTPPGLLARA